MKHTNQKMSDDELAGLEEEIRTARDHLEGMLSMVQDPYARGQLHKYVDQLYYSANKWLDHCIAVSGIALSAGPHASHEEGSKDISERRIVTD